MNYHTGTRVAFGRPGRQPRSSRRPCRHRVRFPRGSSPCRSAISLVRRWRSVFGDVGRLARIHGTRRVYVIAPMVSFAMDRPEHVIAKLERRWRVQVTKRCLREVEKVRANGASVVVLGPGPEDLEAIGANLMDVGIVVGSTCWRPVCVPACRRFATRTTLGPTTCRCRPRRSFIVGLAGQPLRADLRSLRCAVELLRRNAFQLAADQRYRRFDVGIDVEHAAVALCRDGRSPVDLLVPCRSRHGTSRSSSRRRSPVPSCLSEPSRSAPPTNFFANDGISVNRIAARQSCSRRRP